MKTAVYQNNVRLTGWFDAYLEAINWCLSAGVLVEITEHGYRLEKSIKLKFKRQFVGR